MNKAFSLLSCCYNEGWQENEIFAKDLIRAEVGTRWDSEPNSNCRDEFYEDALVVAKDDKCITVEHSYTDERLDFNSGVTYGVETKQRVVYSLPNGLETIRFPKETRRYYYDYYGNEFEME